MGCFIGYNSKSKGYRIFWPSKRSITVKRNVVFNGNDVLSKESGDTITIGVQSEGEQNKVIQHPENFTEVDDWTVNNHEPVNKGLMDANNPDTPNTVLFPSTQNQIKEVENDDKEQNQYG